MPLIRRLRKRGNSLALTIPKPFAEMLDLKTGDAVALEVIGRDSIVVKVARPLG